MTEQVDDFLAHYGIPGMKWGRRNRRDSVNTDTKSERPKMTIEAKKALAKKVAIGTGTLILAAGTAYAVYHLKSKGNTKASDMSISPKAKAATDSILKDPISVIYASRGKNKGFRFFNDGQSPSPLAEFEKGFGREIEQPDGYFRKYEGKIATVFNDPEGRKDRAGRTIPHQIIIPKTMTDGINNTNDVVDKLWPKLKLDYNYE